MNPSDYFVVFCVLRFLIIIGFIAILTVLAFIPMFWKVITTDADPWQRYQCWEELIEESEQIKRQIGS